MCERGLSGRLATAGRPLLRDLLCSNRRCRREEHGLYAWLVAIDGFGELAVPRLTEKGAAKNHHPELFELFFIVNYKKRRAVYFVVPTARIDVEVDGVKKTKRAMGNVVIHKQDITRGELICDCCAGM